MTSPRRRHRSRALRSSTAALLCVLTGCYGYVPLRSGEAAAGDAVRAHLAAPQTVVVGGRTLHEVSSVDGEVVGQQRDTLLLWARRLDYADGVSRPAAGVALPLPSASVSALERRRLDRTRTALFTGLVAIALFALDRGLASWGGGSEGGPGGGNPVPR